MIQINKVSKIGLSLVVLSMAAVGGLLVAGIRAATYVASSEAEAGAFSGYAAPASDPKASAGQAIKFGVAVNSVEKNYTATGVGPKGLQGFAVTGKIFVNAPTAQMTQMLRAFPNLNVIRIAIGTSPANVVPSVDQAALKSAIDTAIQMVPTIQIVLDDHQAYGAAQIGNTAADLALYQKWATDYKNYPQVSFNTTNEPGGDSLQITAAEKQVYDTIRSTGAKNRIWLEYGGYFPTAYQSLIDNSKMVNIGMDIHLYPRSDTANASADIQAANIAQIKDSQGVPLQQTAFEFGPSLTGPPSGNTASSVAYVGQTVAMAKSGTLAAATAWVWSNGGSLDGLEDLIVDGNSTIGQFGLLLQSREFATTPK